MDAQQLALLLIMITVVVVLFLALRRFVWWYWGIDQHLENQRQIIAKLAAQIELQQVLADQEARRRTTTTPPVAQSAPPQNRPNPLTGHSANRPEA